jgi:hypothetical protein
VPRRVQDGPVKRPRIINKATAVAAATADAAQAAAAHANAKATAARDAALGAATASKEKSASALGSVKSTAPVSGAITAVDRVAEFFSGPEVTVREIFESRGWSGEETWVAGWNLNLTVRKDSARAYEAAAAADNVVHQRELERERRSRQAREHQAEQAERRREQKARGAAASRRAAEKRREQKAEREAAQREEERLQAIEAEQAHPAYQLTLEVTPLLAQRVLNGPRLAYLCGYDKETLELLMQPCWHEPPPAAASLSRVAAEALAHLIDREIEGTGNRERDPKDAVPADDAETDSRRAGGEL